MQHNSGIKEKVEERLEKWGREKKIKKEKNKQEEREETEERQLKNCLFIKAVNNI